MYILKDLQSKSDSKRSKANNDCCIIALANCFNLGYDKAYDLCKSYYSNGRGMSLQYYMPQVLDKMGKKYTVSVYENPINLIDFKFDPDKRYLMAVAGQPYKSGYKKGFFRLRHAICVKFGVIFNNWAINYEDFLKDYPYIQVIIEIIEE